MSPLGVAIWAVKPDPEHSRVSAGVHQDAIALDVVVKRFLSSRVTGMVLMQPVQEHSRIGATVQRECQRSGRWKIVEEITKKILQMPRR